MQHHNYLTAFGVRPCSKRKREAPAGEGVREGYLPLSLPGLHDAVVDLISCHTTDDHVMVQNNEHVSVHKKHNLFLG